MSVRLTVMASVGVALAVLLGTASPAAATQGSVPPEVAEFAVAPDGLILGLADFFGPGADGKGIDFDDSTEIGSVDRVFTFAPEWLAGGAADTAVGLANEWAVPVAVGGEAVGVAIIWINPSSVRPQLADFVPDRKFAEALAAAPDQAYVVSDKERGAWFSLVAPTLTSLLTGTSGVDGELPLAAYRPTITETDASPPVDEGPSLGSVLSVGTIVAVSLAVILVLLVPVARRRRKAAAEAKDTPDEVPEALAEPAELDADEK